jgi:hypothetical protein
MREYECTECRRRAIEPLAMRECAAGCGGIFCEGCLPDHEMLCLKRRDDEFLRSIHIAAMEIEAGYGWGV